MTRAAFRELAQRCVAANPRTTALCHACLGDGGTCTGPGRWTTCAACAGTGSVRA